MFLQILILSSLLSVSSLAQVDALEDIKRRMSQADCCRFEFISILESDLFDSVDSTLGWAEIAGDGQYRLAIGPDEYLRIDDKLYAYSKENNQVTIERVGQTDPAGEGISFITRLDTFYKTEILKAGREYRLERLDGVADNMPMVMTLFLTAGAGELDRLEYFDQNDDLNRIVFIASTYLPACDGSVLEPRYPDSTEIIKLY